MSNYCVKVDIAIYRCLSLLCGYKQPFRSWKQYKKAFPISQSLLQQSSIKTSHCCPNVLLWNGANLPARGSITISCIFLWKKAPPFNQLLLCKGILLYRVGYFRHSRVQKQAITFCLRMYSILWKWHFNDMVGDISFRAVLCDNLLCSL